MAEIYRVEYEGKLHDISKEDFDELLANDTDFIEGEEKTCKGVYPIYRLKPRQSERAKAAIKRILGLQQV